MRWLFSIFVFLITLTAGSAQEPRLNDPKMLVGAWKIGADSGAPAREAGMMSVQADGRILIAGGDRINRQQTPATVSDQEAVALYRKTIVFAGKYSASPGAHGILEKMTIEIDEATDPSLIGKRIDVGLKVHSAERFATGVPEMGSAVLNNIWVKARP
jgi:hypothetical protein